MACIKLHLATGKMGGTNEIASFKNFGDLSVALHAVAAVVLATFVLIIWKWGVKVNGDLRCNVVR